MKNKNKLFTWLLILTLLASSLACSIFLGGPNFPETPIPISTDAAVNLQEQAKTAVASAGESGIITLEFTETQVTSLVAAKLSSDPNAAISDPQVYLRNGQMEIHGKIKQGYFTANVEIVIAVGVDSEGQPTIDIVSADFGPLPVPEGLREAITAGVKEAYTGSLGPVATGFRLESVTIADGVMTITGQIK
jgi:hypothetical protein